MDPCEEHSNNYEVYLLRLLWFIITIRGKYNIVTIYHRCINKMGFGVGVGIRCDLEVQREVHCGFEMEYKISDREELDDPL